MYNINPVINMIANNSAQMHETTIIISVESNPTMKRKQTHGMLCKDIIIARLISGNTALSLTFVQLH